MRSIYNIFRFFWLEILKSAPHLLVKWEVVSPNSRTRATELPFCLSTSMESGEMVYIIVNYTSLVYHEIVMNVEERFFVSSREFCPAHRRGHWRFAVWAHCVSVFARACSVLLFTCLHTYTSYK